MANEESDPSFARAAFTPPPCGEDEHTLNLEYHSRPEILQNILANARQMLCPVKRVTLYEDVSFVSKSKEEDTVEERHELQQVFTGTGAAASKPVRQTTARSSSAQGKPEAKKRVQQEQPERKDAKAKKVSNQALQRRMQKVISHIAPHKLQLTDMLGKVKTIPRLTALIPKYVISSSEETLTGLNRLYEQCQKGLGGEEFGEVDLPDDLALKTLCGECATCVQRLKVQMNQAEMFVESSEP